MNRSETSRPRFVGAALLRPARLVSRLCQALRQVHDVDERGHLLGEDPSAPQSPDHSLLSHLSGGGSPAPFSDDVLLCQRYTQTAQELWSPLPATYGWFNPTDVSITGKHPVGAGGFANIWEGVLNGRKVIVKSYRCYLLFDRARIISRFHKELHISNHISHRNVVSLIGVWSTEAHPFCLVYEYMANFDLGQYLRGEPGVGRLMLLVGVARGLDYLHNLDIVHGDLRTANILVKADGTVCIAGLGSASILSHSTPRPLGNDLTPHSCTLESVWTASPQDASSHPADKANDMHAFGLVAWEIFTGRSPFFDMTETAAAHSMLKGARPPRPDHHEVSDRVWGMIERCWESVPSRRVPAREVVELLEAELRQTSDSRT